MPPAPPAPPDRRPQATPRLTRSTPPRRRSPLLTAAGMAVPAAATAATAALPSLVPLPTPGEGLPLPLLLVLAVQLVGLFFARELELVSWRRLWLMLLATTALLFPALALQAAAAREPFVSRALGSAGTLAWLTPFAIAALLGLAALAVLQGVSEPQHASVFFAPAALLVPAILGASGDFGEAPALAALAETAALTAVATAGAWLVPPGARLLVGPAALAVQFGVLWLLGYQPTFGAGHGAIVPILSGLVVIAAIAATVLVPVAALALHRLLRAVAQPRTGPAPKAEPRAPVLGSAGFDPEWGER